LREHEEEKKVIKTGMPVEHIRLLNSCKTGPFETETKNYLYKNGLL
jgi:hypothetical protein